MAAQVLTSSARAKAAVSPARRRFIPGPWHFSSSSDAFCAA
ncbi:HMG-CoA-red domain-containing protein [Pyrenophora tritici-repentis]|uniref:Uncharacterized protein n=1 Tax=Pyrenophora tritici-repentis TaxID=45151 RepID=A0A834VQQ9_9PLEO|nr:hypothetical protein PtrM4_074350 [Pyrenophora tritici-repentis]KAI0568851.1 HMG-CoA-red domain-containing protein [Pyrenophora tritici-repentis]KAI0570054.1 HMG-CoA-red domain-containing protein [Pyrenophora tritici-repentis]KAI0603986.1 HMG-CoA-red domain-containing protein [Pyrenophora tritici-repentis]KAI0616195.1 HMG-CoA-red domain-containing protein [Pyrenophora tritici-repentis]